MEFDYRRQESRGQETGLANGGRGEPTRRRGTDRITLTLRNDRNSRGRSDSIVVPDVDTTTMLLIPTRLMRHKAASRLQTSSARSGVPHVLGSMRNAVKPGPGWTRAMDTHTVNTSADRTQPMANDTTVTPLTAMPTFRGERGYYGRKHYGNFAELVDLSLPTPRLKNQLNKLKQPQYIDIVRPMSSAGVYTARRCFTGRDTTSDHFGAHDNGPISSDVNSCPSTPSGRRNQKQQTVQHSEHTSIYPRRRVLSKTPHCSPVGSQEDLRNTFPSLRQNNQSADVLLRVRHQGQGDVTSGKKNHTWDRVAEWTDGRTGGAVGTCPNNKDGFDTHDGAGVNGTKYTLTVYVPCATNEGSSHRV